MSNRENICRERPASTSSTRGRGSWPRVLMELSYFWLMVTRMLVFFLGVTTSKL